MSAPMSLETEQQPSLRDLVLSMDADRRARLDAERAAFWPEETRYRPDPGGKGRHRGDRAMRTEHILRALSDGPRYTGRHRKDEP